MSEWHSVDFVPQGWQCPICKRVYSPTTPICYCCGNGVPCTYSSTTVTVGDAVDAHKTVDDTPTSSKWPEAVKPTINEYGSAYCVCGTNVGIIPDDKGLLKIRTNYCPECGRRMIWE